MVKTRVQLALAALSVSLIPTRLELGPSYVTIQFGRAIEGSYTNPGVSQYRGSCGWTQRLLISRQMA